MIRLPVDGNLDTQFCNSTTTTEWVLSKENKEMHT